MTPKRLHRHKLCVSKLKDMGPETTFHRVMMDPKDSLKNSKIKIVQRCLSIPSTFSDMIISCSRSPSAANLTASSAAKSRSLTKKIESTPLSFLR